jgi:hypothetical protein
MTSWRLQCRLPPGAAVHGIIHYTRVADHWQQPPGESATGHLADSCAFQGVTPALAASASALVLLGRFAFSGVMGYNGYNQQSHNAAVLGAFWLECSWHIERL